MYNIYISNEFVRAHFLEKQAPISRRNIDKVDI